MKRSLLSQVSMVCVTVAIISAVVFLFTLSGFARLNLTSARGIFLVICIVTSLIGLLCSGNIKNAILRRFGEPASAKILAVRQTGVMTNRGGVWRVKLEVHPSAGEHFIAVAEEYFWNSIDMDSGDTVSVKYISRI